MNIHDSVLREMDRPGSNHRDPWFAPFFAQVLEDSKYIFQTKKASTVIYPGTGTGGWEAALQNTLSPGDKIVTFRYGQFSHLWIDQMQVSCTFTLLPVISLQHPARSVHAQQVQRLEGYCSELLLLQWWSQHSNKPYEPLHLTGSRLLFVQRLGLDVEVIECRWGDGADEAKLQDILSKDKDKKIKAVAVVHNETTTGVTSDIAKVRPHSAVGPVRKAGGLPLFSMQCSDLSCMQHRRLLMVQASSSSSFMGSAIFQHATQ